MARAMVAYLRMGNDAAIVLLCDGRKLRCSAEGIDLLKRLSALSIISILYILISQGFHDDVRDVVDIKLVLKIAYFLLHRFCKKP